MAVVSTDALYTRLREVLEAGEGTLREIPEGTFGGVLPEELSDRSLAVKALAKPRTEAWIIKWETSPNSPPLYSNLAIYVIEVRIRVVRLLTLVAHLGDVNRDAVKALAGSDADLIRQAVSFPGNLLVTAGGVETGLLSGLLTYRSSTATVRSMAADSLSVIETDHLFAGSIRSTPVT